MKFKIGDKITLDPKIKRKYRDTYLTIVSTNNDEYAVSSGYRVKFFKKEDLEKCCIIIDEPNNILKEIL